MEGDVDDKVRRFMKLIIPYIRTHKDYYIVVLTELPYDDPDNIEYKESWIRKIVDLVQDQICTPLSANADQKNNPLSHRGCHGRHARHVISGGTDF